MSERFSLRAKRIKGSGDRRSAVHVEFAKIIGCERCNRSTCSKLLRDNLENVPQPGYIGINYEQTGVLLIGQNPAVPGRLAETDRPYTAALRALRDDPTPETYGNLQEVLGQFIPDWPVHGDYFPLRECGLELADVAYFNFVRCRTAGNAKPNAALANSCRTYLERWLDLLKPNVVAFVGKWAYDNGKAACERRSIPCSFVNRDRSLSGSERQQNRSNVAASVMQNARTRRDQRRSRT